MGSGGKKSEDVEEQDGLDEGVVGQGKKVVGCEMWLTTRPKVYWHCVLLLVK